MYIRVENIVTGCYNTVALPLLVNPLPVIVQPTPLAVCDDLVADSFEQSIEIKFQWLENCWDVVGK